MVVHFPDGRNETFGICRRSFFCYEGKFVVRHTLKSGREVLLISGGRCVRYRCTPGQFRSRYGHAGEYEGITYLDIESMEGVLEELLVEHYLKMFLTAI